MRPRSARFSLAGYALAALVLALTAAGCAAPGTGGDGGDGVATVGGTASPSASASPDGAAGLDQQEKALKFAQCMREHGVDMPDPQFENGRIKVQIGGGPGDEETIEAAQEACREYAPMGGPDGKPDPQMQETMRKMAQCMREHGVEDFPDPQADGGVRIDGNIGDDPDFPQAQKVCEDQFLPGAGGTRTSG
jgi:hypothetical protein